MTAVAGALTTLLLVQIARQAEVRPRARRLRAEHPVLPGGVRRLLAVALDRAALDVTPEDALVLWGAAAAVAALLGTAFSVPLGVFGVAAVAVGGPVGLHLARHRRDDLTRALVPDLLEEVARHLRAGGTVRDAVERLAARPDALGREADVAARRLRVGLPVSEALRGWADDRPDAATAACALVVASGTGGRAAAALDATAAALRDRAALAAEVRALSAQGRWSAAVVGALPAVSLASSLAMGGTAAHALLHTGSGRVALVLGLALEVLGLWCIRRIVAVET